MRSVRIAQQTATFALHNISRLVLCTEVETVHCAVRTESLHTIDTFSLYKVNFDTLDNAKSSLCLYYVPSQDLTDPYRLTCG